MLPTPVFEVLFLFISPRPQTETGSCGDVWSLWYTRVGCRMTWLRRGAASL